MNIRACFLSATLAILAVAHPALAQQPQIAELLPSGVIVGGAEFELVIRGAGFVPGVSRVQFNGAALQAPRISATEIRVRVPGEFFGRAPFVSEGDFRNGVYSTSVVVMNGPQSGAPMASKRFEIRKPGVGATQAFNAPIVTAISPNPVPVGGTITVTGDNFRPAGGGSDDFIATLVASSGARFNTQVGSRSRTQLVLVLAGVPGGSYALEILAVNTGREATVRAQETVVVGAPTAYGPVTISNVGPSPVTTRGGTLYLEGTNFGESAVVTLVAPAGAGEPRILARAPNATQTAERLYVQLPALQYPGGYSLQVANPGGSPASRALAVQHPEQAQVERIAAARGARPERPRPPAPGVAAVARGQVGYRFSDVTEYCFGAVGPKCDGAPNAGVTKNADGTVTMMVSVGSILHDNCCLAYPPSDGNPGGKFCNGPVSEVSHNGQCVLEWDKAFWNTVTDGRQWPWTFNPTQRADLTVTEARASRFQDMALRGAQFYTGRETTDTRKLLAPAGTALDVGDEAFCASGKAVGKSFAAKRWIVCE